VESMEDCKERTNTYECAKDIKEETLKLWKKKRRRKKREPLVEKRMNKDIGS